MPRSVNRLVIGISGASGADIGISLLEILRDLRDWESHLVISRGTFKTAGMIIAPCSMKTLAGIACGYSDNLLLRAADVTIKEGRPLALVVRESPLSAIHLKNMLELARMGGGDYARDLDDMTRHIAAKSLDRFGIEVKGFKRWGE
jgi:4-hydroxy-3-polyprenylbenzoate decarboxylase